MEKKLTIKQWRLLKGESQKEFSKNIGMNFSTYKTKESGKVEWNGSELIRISLYLNKSLDTEINF